MRTLFVAVVLMAFCPTARAQDVGDCDRITLASKDGSIRRRSDAAIDQSLCATFKLVWDAAMSVNKAQEDRCEAATSAVMRELMRRKRDPQQVRAKCNGPG
jgi:hypothetical protein